jgi:aspartyl/asparaginyl beta-hydroxylase (cupin superfamily)
MRDDILTMVEDMERRTDGSCSTVSLYERLKRWTTTKAAAEVQSSQAFSIPLAPQKGQEPTVFFLPNLEATPFHHGPDKCYNSCPCLRLWKTQPIDPKSPPIPTTGDIEMLQKSFDIIRTELDNLLSTNEDEFAPFDRAVYSSSDKNKQIPEWSSVYLFHQGLKQPACNLFPRTTDIVERLPNQMAGKCGLGSIYFSKLKSNTKVNEHCGPTNVRWRCHLPLVVPQNNKQSQLCVGVGANKETVEWEEGVPILFDDSFLHSAVHVGYNDNTKDGSRIVLIIDFWHPTLSEADRNAIGVLYPPGS